MRHIAPRHLHRTAAALALAVVLTLTHPPTFARAAMPSSVRFVHYAVTGAQINGTNAHTSYSNNAASDSVALTWIEGRDYATGIDAAFLEANDAGGIHGAPVQRYHLEHDGVTTDAAAVSTPYAAALASGGVFGTGATAYGLSVSVHAAAEAAGMAAVGNINSLTSAFDVDQSRFTINIRMPFAIDLRTLAQYAVQSQLRCKRSGILYDPSDADDQGLANELRTILADIGYAAPAPIAITSTAAFLTNVSTTFAFASPLERPQCLFILVDTAGVLKALQLLTAHPDFNVTDYAILTPSVVYASDWRSVAGYSSGYYSNLYSMSHFPNPDDTRYTVSRSFQAAAELLFASGYPKATVASVRGDAAAAASWRPSYPAMEGYLIGRLFVEACRATSPTNFTAANVLNSFYHQKRFVLDDWPLGPYSDECVGRSSLLSYACKCNSGTRRLFMNKVNTTSGTTDQLYDDERFFEVGVAETAIPDSACSVAQVTAAVPLTPPQIHAILVSRSAPTEISRIVEVAIRSMYARVKATTLSNGADVDIIPRPLTEGFNLTAAAALTTIPAGLQLIGYAASAMSDTERDSVKTMRGIVNIAPLRYRWALKDDPLPPFAQWNPYYMPLFSTLTDYANAAVARAVDKSPAGASRVVIIADTEAYAAQIARTVVHHQQLPLSTRVLFAANPAHATQRFTDAGVDGAGVTAAIDAALASATDADTILFVSQNLDALQHAFETRATHASRTIVFVASEFVIYDALVATLAANASLSASTSPWYATNNNSWYFVSAFATWRHTTTLESLADPAVAYTALIAQLILEVTASVTTTSGVIPTSAELLETMYNVRRIGPIVARATVGTFANQSCGNTVTLDDHPGGNCQCNRGASDPFVRPLHSWFRAIATNDASAISAAADYSYRTLPGPTNGCGLTLLPMYVAPASTAARDLALIVSGVVLAIILLFAIAYKISQRGKRDNSCAPKDATQPFAMVFTDIQSSTTMWARAPQHMGPAVDAHHELIRALIPAHRGYEVKTIGDSFMVAFKSARDAVDFACELQSTFFDHTWGTEVFDETYKELIADSEHRRLAEEAAAASKAGKTVAEIPFKVTCDDFDDNPYDRKVWNGLRVRVGVHFGTGDIKLDPVSQGYDYYGTVVNTAARVEGVAHGGQIAVTAAVVAALTDGGERTLASLGLAAVDFGPQPLRGLDDPIGLTQVLPARFAARTYPPLRLDVEKEVEVSGEDSSDDGKGSHLSHCTARTSSTVASGRSSVKYTTDDLIAHVVRHATERRSAVRRVLFGKITLETMLSTATPKWREATIAYLADKWRIGQLRKQPGMGRYRRRLGALDVDLVLLAYRISTAAERTHQVQSETSDGGDNSTLRMSNVTDHARRDSAAGPSEYIADTTSPTGFRLRRVGFPSSEPSSPGLQGPGFPAMSEESAQPQPAGV